MPLKLPPRDWIDAKRNVARSPAAVYIGGLSVGSRRTIQQSLAAIAAMIAGEGADPVRLRWERLRRPDTIAIRTELKERYAPATANKMLSALRGVLRAARDLNLMLDRDYQLAASVEYIDQARLQSHHHVGFEQIARLFEACTRDNEAGSRRDAAALAIFLSSGLRRAESVALDVQDYDPATGRLHIRGERPEYNRIIELGPPARAAVNHWLDLRSMEPGPLLLPVGRGGLIRFRRLTDQTAYDMLSRIARRARLAHLTSRDLRRAYVLSLIRAGKTLDEVQYLTGHASWITTHTYQQLATKTKDKGYDVRNLPYQIPVKGDRHERASDGGGG